MDKPLKIYSASAGSGKTYTLVKTYLELILKGDAQPLNFSKIIAMTFTNKAALEMKTRIISALDNLSNPERVPENTEKAKKYLADISKDFGMKPEEVQKKAQIALTHILHQYEDFYVMTIDKFNLRLIRSFAMDLNLDANFKVIIDETEITQRVTEDFLNEIDDQFTSVLSKLFVQLAEEKMSDGENWNFERELSDYLKILGKEEAIELLNQTDEETYSSETFDLIKLQIRHLDQKIEENAEQFLDKIQPVVDDIDDKRKKNSIVGLIEKLKANKSRISSEMKMPLTDAQIRYLENNELPEHIVNILTDFYVKHLDFIAQAEQLNRVKKSFHYIRLLKKIHDRLQEFRQTEQIIRISEFNRMISDLLKNESSPFIYEKLGTRFNHFLLDEFQDTSRLQWQNIIPLVHEALSQQYQNLIVGDPKQSIYRFRGGVADQFVALPAVYNPKNEASLKEISGYFEKMGIREDLGDNYRSSKEIVEFNNLFFTELVKFIRQEKEIDYTSYYDSIVQNPKSEKKGYIELISLKEKARSAGDEDSEEENSSENIRFLLSRVEECIRDGYEKGDICVLGDTARLCNEYAIALSQKGYKVVSSDSLAVDSDQTVKLCIIYLSWRNQPSNDLAAKRFAEKFLSIRFPEDATRLYMSYMNERPAFNEESGPVSYFNTRQFVNDYFESWENFHFPFENLYALLERFYQISGLNELENPYLHHLSDLAFNYDLNNGPDLNTFLDFYGKTGKNSSIQTPENKDAVKIMTAHKSKGLEFKIVIIPQLNNNFLKNKAKYLIQLDEHLSYTTLSQKVLSPKLKDNYTEEYTGGLLDKLNLYYVAFTRPIDRLYVMNYIKSNSSVAFGPIFHEFLQTPVFESHTAEKEIIGKEREFFRFQFGERVTNPASFQANEANNFVPENVSDKLWFPSISLKNHLEDIDESIEEQRRYGRQLHYILSELEHFNDSTEAIEILQKKGLIEKAFSERLLQDIQHITSSKMYEELHQGKKQVINEQSIIISESEVKRPDKIIVKDNETIVLDFKTGLKTGKDLKQIKNYCEILEQMDFPNVRGIVLYTQELEFVEV